MTTNPKADANNRARAAEGAPPAPISDGLVAFLAVLAPAIATVSPLVPGLNPAVARSLARVSPEEFQAIPMIIEMLRTFPVLSGVTADELEGVMDDASQCAEVERVLESLLDRIRGTRRMRVEFGWRVAYDTLVTGRKRAKLSGAIADEVAAIDAILAVGPRDEQAGHVAVTAQAKAAKALERSNKAQEKSNAATARAAELANAKK